MASKPETETTFGSEAARQGRAKAAEQRAHSVRFWETAVWTKEEKAKTLAPANEARDLIVTDISLQKGSKLSRLINRKKIRETTKILSATEIEEVDDEMLQRQIKEEMDLAESQQRQWEYKNSTSNTVISFINDFVEFVGEFSGIIEIMKGVDQGYGGAGYAALSFLLGVAVNTKRKDNLVAEAMLNLKNEYSRMVLISEIYPTPQMRTYITTVYKLGIEFVQDAAAYYSRPTWRRLWDSIARPPFMLNRKVNEISAAMVQIVKERDTLLNKRVGELSQDVQQVKMEVTELHINHQKERLGILSSDLSHYDIQPDKTIGQYSALLNVSFDRPPGLARFCYDILKTKEQYLAWKNSNRDCMLVLNGRTKADQTSCCWLSPASVETASALKQEASDSAAGSRIGVVELYCQKTDFMPGNIKRMSAIVCLLIQLLETDSTILRDAERFEDIRTRLTKLDSKSESDFRHVCGLLVEVIKKFDVVYFIIDRVDRISGDFIKDFLKNVVLAQTDAKVKALCVASRDQDIVKKIDSLSYEVDEKKFLTLQIDQDRMER